jgi:hypothetical protein
MEWGILSGIWLAVIILLILVIYYHANTTMRIAQVEAKVDSLLKHHNLPSA